MLLPDFSIRRPVAAVMMTAALVIFGLISLGRLPVREMPDIDFPVVSVVVAYPGASPEVVEEDVTDPIEEQVNTVEGIRFIQSQSLEGGAQITVQFELERNVDVAAQEVRDKVAAIRRDLPDEIDEPVISKLDLDAQAIMWIGVTASDRDRVEISEYADKVLKPQFERLPGVGQIILGAKQLFAVRIWLDPDRLAGHQLTVADVARALRTQNAEVPSGRLEGLMREFSVRTEGDIESVVAFEDLVLAHRDGTPVLLRDVGRAEPGPRGIRETGRFSSLPDIVGRDAVALGVLKQTEANTVDVARAIKAQLAEIQAEVPEGIDVRIAFDSSIYVEDSIAELKETLFLGGSLAAVVIFLFLGSIRPSLITALAIPTSILATFAVMDLLGFTLNNLSMLALVLAVGMVIDDAVVVVENVFRHRESGKGPVDAARDGASEIGFAIIAASLSIVVVFLPLAFVKGMVGRLFFEFAVTVAGAILVSLLIALTLIPMLASRFLGVQRDDRKRPRLIDRGLGRLSSGYGRVLRASLRARWVVILVAVVVMALSRALFNDLGKELNPPVDEGTFVLIMKGPQGATLEFSDRYLREIEQIMSEIPEMASYFTAIGLTPGGGVPKVHEAISFVRLKRLDERQALGLRGQYEVMAELRRRFAEVPGFQTIVLPRPTLLSVSRQSAPLQFVVMGPEIDELYEYGRRLEREVAKVPGLVDVTIDLDVNKPQLRVHPDRERAADLGVPLTQVADTLRILFGGDDITEFKRGGETYDVMVQLEAGARRVPSSIDGIYMPTRSGELVQLASLIRVEETVGPSEIPRYNRGRAFTLEANLEDVPLGQALDQVEAIAAEVLPPGFRTTVTGQSEDMRESFASLGFALILAIVVIYMVLASQFNHFVHPFTIMLSLPLAIFGALGLVWLMGLTVNLFSIIGIIMLMGIVTRNAILLVDYANQLRRDGDVERDEAIVTAGRVRLRPILMTAGSTILGVMPALVGIGAGTETRQPLAAAVVGGMTTSTLLTLLVVPVVYTLMDDVGRIAIRVVRRRQTGAEA